MSDFQRLDRPPTTRQLQQHFGLSRKEAVRFHKDWDTSFTHGKLISLSEWHSIAFRYAQDIKSNRRPAAVQAKVEQIIKQATAQLTISHSADISLNEGHRLEAK
jgi:hypothetical protein